MSTRLKKHRIVGHTGGGDYSNNHWPHPTNQEFNRIIRSVMKIYGSGPKEEAMLLRECKEYLLSRVKKLVDHKIKRESEEYYQAMGLEITHGFSKTQEERQKMISEADIVLFVGNWRENKPSVIEYKYGNTIGKPLFEMYHDDRLPVDSIQRYLQPIRPILDSEWDDSKKDDILVYENEEGLLELMDGNHRHEFATRLGTVPYLSGWVIRRI